MAAQEDRAVKALLMHSDRDFDVQRPLPVQAEIVRRDLALDTLLAAMADDDELISKTACNALLNACVDDADSIRYRQAVVRDAIAHPEPVREMYDQAGAALEEKRKSYWSLLSSHPSSILYGSIEVLRLFMRRLRSLREIAEAHAGQFESDGFRNLFAMLQREFDDVYLARVDALLAELKFPDGTLVSARLGPECESEDYVLRRPREHGHHWLNRLLERVPSASTVRIAQRDLTGAKTLGEMRDRGINDVANALAQATDHIQGFFEMLRAELAFHVGCINLHRQLTDRSVPTCFPEPLPATDSAGLRAHGLRDPSLALTTQHDVAANDIDAEGKSLVVITGANQGGKSTFLRSFGLAQLMLQSGMFVTAEAFASTLCTGLFTHYKREEDATMQQGKLDEELIRIGEIADAIRPGALLLCNESFASTNEREGSELARQLVAAMSERKIRVAFVTHLYTFAHAAYEQHREDAMFLRAQRLPDGTRTFKLIEGAPRETSYGGDLYREIFGDDAPATAAPVADTPAPDDGSRTAQAGR
jgi:DNA mismatch repair ATPase MutS